MSEISQCVTNIRFQAAKLMRQWPSAAAWTTVDDLAGVGNLVMVEKLEEFEPARGYKLWTYISPWALGAMRNALKGTRLSEELLDEHAAPSDTSADTRLDHAAVVREIASLEPRTRAIVRARWLDGTPLSAAAISFNLSPTRTYQLEQQGLRQLRETLRGVL